MASEEFQLGDDFPPASYAQWRELAKRDLRGKPFDEKLVTSTYEGIDVQPIYTQRDWPSDHDAAGFPGLPPYTRGSQTGGIAQHGCDIRQLHAHPDLAIANQAIVDDVAGGVSSLLLKFDATTRAGWDADNAAAAELAVGDGLMVYSVDDLERLLEGVDLNQIGIAVDAGGAFAPAAAMLAALWQRRGLATNQVRGSLNADPLGTLARDGRLPNPVDVSLSAMAALATWTSSDCPNVTAVGVDTSMYHDAGASATQDLAFAAATGVEYLRALTADGMDTDTAARQMLFSFSLGTHHFRSIAKLRAARRIWSRVIDLCGGTNRAGGMRIHARTARRGLTARDPHMNLLRNTAAMFAACAAGAEAITSEPFDAALGLPSDASRRTARNTLHVLQDEAHLHRVIDPAGGSWYLEQLTNQLSEQAWKLFQQIEQQGGMRHAIESGSVASQVEATATARAQDVATRESGIIGVSQHATADEQPTTAAPDMPMHHRTAAERVRAVRPTLPWLSPTEPGELSFTKAIEEASNGATIGQLAVGMGFHSASVSAAALPLRPLAEPFELLRNASDAYFAANGRRPSVFVACLGAPADHADRAKFTKEIFTAGGFGVLTDILFATQNEVSTNFKKSNANIAVICSSNKLYPELVPQAAACLKLDGATTVLVAGRPDQHEAEWRAAGVDRFIFSGCNVVGILRDLLKQEGVDFA